MPKKTIKANPPPEAAPEAETNRYLRKIKSSLSKRWSVSRMETLYDISDLAHFLWALEREEEALAITAAVATAIPSPPEMSGGKFNYNIWCPATHAHALIVHLDSHGNQEQVEASRRALMGDPGISRTNPAFLVDRVADAGRLAATPVGQDTLKWECQSLARALGTMVLYVELAKAGDTFFEPHRDAAEAALPGLLTKLRTRLHDAR